ncbi:uncharacterized protein HMPREF1541_00792 [Cyphellophora europaea CBS 101466]|uniref:Uncharacterized protein n=1 Tax=Cyphellophora europaea (strain CBS 101466) TaxID=1220924 RepID=W2SD01_CYPE1|nr:uncharacterized protein HMPREF1541_00792 [Cyphellophora europaea CBS 101466]ETN46606.1 hypothetical protein HMPREF1541_00792 [Cyphellophora europaea CBS 101466]
MSSRALRKLQREQEEQRRLAAAHATENQVEEESDEAPQSSRAPQPKNAFDMLEEAEDDESEDDTTGVATPATDSAQPERLASISRPTPSSKSKKKKKRPKKKPKDTPDKASKPESDSGDEIDRALKALALKSGAHNAEQSEDISSQQWEAEATKLLGVETKNLNPINEMKSLFGNVAVEEHESRSNRATRQREVNEQGGMDLGTALLGRNNVASRRKELGALANRRNCLMRGKEEWPLASSGGLSMENVSEPPSFEKRYNLVHGHTYREAQWNFQMAVESMDPQRMMSLLLMSPYHIASLLQVAEIARHQGDHSVSGDLLERALYTLGKSVHSSFPAAMREGTARISFDKASNREFYLAIWRYIRNLEMRGTFKTAFEWAKLLLQFNTLSDPYGVTLMIDQLALRGRCHDQLIALASPGAYGTTWQHLPNIKISLALALTRAKRSKEARQHLAIAMVQYPYILSALASALDISPLPKVLWAKLPSTDAEKLYTELYVSRAKDLWNTPETTALLVEVAETLTHYQPVTSSAPTPPKLEISLEEARHILLLESPQLLGLLPRNFTRMATTGYDPLPPPSSEENSDFTARAPADASGPSALQNIIGGAGTGGIGMLNRILNWFTSPAGPAADGNGNNDQEGQEAMRALRQELGPDVPDVIIQELLQAHLGQGGDEEDHDGQVIIDPEGLGLGQRVAPGATPGGWDYYAERAEEPSDDYEEDESDLPELEDIPTAETRPGATPTPPPETARNPRAAMVEEILDDDDNAGHDSTPIGRGILRHIDSDEEDDGVDSDGIRPHPRAPTHTLLSTNAPPQRVVPPSQRRASSAAGQAPQAGQQPTLAELADSGFSPAPVDVEGDPQRLQRWLLTSGLDGLQDKESGSPEMQLYVKSLKLLRAQQRDWVLNVVGQRGAEWKACVERVRAML